ncbi:hypothetical protein SADUNF_Sadunf02G0122100 [Salix dunnii]|uniref:Gnk2-homologous domain-containing protein n=1 Tax=Salix dunnii TaxID=1413687 RepID=A0A835N7V6_9ROSI|nr:hypothetical protein SADUNF_Sadunf02G0122100 [Salix dunnii]
MRRLNLYSTHKTIPAPPRLTSLFFLFLSLSNYDNFVKAHIYIYADCSQETYAPNSPFEGNHNPLLASIVSSSSQAYYNSFAFGNGSSTSTEGICYGLYQCRGDLKITDCSRCIESAVNQISLVCPYSYGAALQLESCYVRYEHIDFLGRLDKKLKYIKCSKSVNNDVEFFKRRDDVLADLSTAMGFKVSSSGSVEGYAQCFGDLSSSDCSSCLVDAVGQFKNLCGSAAAAAVYLGQCYARYWESGYYDLSSDSSNEDDEGKTVAIVVGIIAGVAIVIVLLSFCRRIKKNTTSGILQTLLKGNHVVTTSLLFVFIYL